MNLLLSITSGVLLVASQTTKKSVRPRLPFTSRRYGLIRFLNCALVKSSLNSNSVYLAATAIAFSRTINNLRTLILSNADGFSRRVLSPNKYTPRPGVDTTGLHPTLYRLSLSALAGLYASLTEFLIIPLLRPAGDHQGSFV